MGLMSVVNSLASSPIGKVAGGYLEGEIDERKEAARLQEEKDKRYANITDGLVNNLLTIEANVIAQATRESQIYDEAKNWAIGKFGDGGLAVVERMRQDGLFSGAQDFNSVLTNSNNLYGASLPQGSEPWYMQPEWSDFAEQYKKYNAPTNVYQNRINSSYGTIKNILSENGIGDFTFDLFTGANVSGSQQENLNVPPEGKITETGPKTDTQPDSQASENIVDINTLGSAPIFGQRGIEGFNQNNFSKATATILDEQFPQFTNMYIIDPINGGLTINKAAFADDPSKYEEATRARSYLDNTLSEARNLYQTGKLKTNNTYGSFNQFFNVEDFDESGFVRKALNDYFNTINQQKSELIKINVLKEDLQEDIQLGNILSQNLAKLSDKLDEAFPYAPGDSLSWENLYLNNVSLKDSKFRQAYEDVVTDFIKNEMRVGSKGKHTMQFIDPTGTVAEVLKGKRTDDGRLLLDIISEADRKKDYVDWYANQLRTTVEGDFGNEPISLHLSRIAPENYADIQSLKLQFNAPEFEIMTPTDTAIDVEAYKPANLEVIAKNKQDRTNVIIPGLPTVASSILASTNMTTGAQVLSWMESLNGDINAMRQAVIGMIVNDIQAGNIDNIPSAQIINLADQVLLDLGTFASDEFSGGSTAVDSDAVISENENIATIENDNIDVNTAIEKEDETADNVLSESLQKSFEEEEDRGVGEDPWLFADGSFNPNWDASGLDMTKKFQFNSDANKYNNAKRKYETEQSQKKFNENISKIWKLVKDNAILEEGETYNTKN